MHGTVCYCIALHGGDDDERRRRSMVMMIMMMMMMMMRRRRRRRRKVTLMGRLSGALCPIQGLPAPGPPHTAMHFW